MMSLTAPLQEFLSTSEGTSTTVGFTTCISNACETLVQRGATLTSNSAPPWADPSKTDIQDHLSRPATSENKKCPQPPAGLLTLYKHPLTTRLSWNGSCLRSAAGNDLSTPRHVLSVSPRPVMRRAGSTIKVFPLNSDTECCWRSVQKGAPPVARGPRQSSRLRGLATRRTRLSLQTAKKTWRRWKSKDPQMVLWPFARQGAGAGPAFRAAQQWCDVYREMDQGRGWVHLVWMSYMHSYIHCWTCTKKSDSFSDKHFAEALLFFKMCNFIWCKYWLVFASCPLQIKLLLPLFDMIKYHHFN